MNYYSMDELRAMGCPNELLMQYVLCNKKEIDRLMTELQMNEQNLIWALRLGIIDWFEFFEMWREL